MEFLIQIQDEGFDVPELNDEPDLDHVQRWYFDAFFKLSRSRQIGFGTPQPITISEIRNYLDIEEVTDPDERKQFIDYIQALDSRYLEWQNEGD